MARGVTDASDLAEVETLAQRWLAVFRRPSPTPMCKRNSEPLAEGWLGSTGGGTRISVCIGIEKIRPRFQSSYCKNTELILWGVLIGADQDSF